MEENPEYVNTCTKKNPSPTDILGVQEFIIITSISTILCTSVVIQEEVQLKNYG